MPAQMFAHKPNTNTTHYVDAATPSGLMAADMTFTCWLSCATLGILTQILRSHTSGVGGFSWRVETTNDLRMFVVDSLGVTVNVQHTPAVALATDTPRFVWGRVSSATQLVEAGVDDSSDSTTAACTGGAAAADSTGRLSMLIRSDPTIGQPLHGHVADLRIYQRALANGEIDEIAGGKGLDGIKDYYIRTIFGPGADGDTLDSSHFIELGAIDPAWAVTGAAPNEMKLADLFGGAADLVYPGGNQLAALVAAGAFR